VRGSSRMGVRSRVTDPEKAKKEKAVGLCTPTLRYGLVFIIHLIIIIVVFTVPTAPGVRQTIPPTGNPTANPTTRSPTTA
jgi:hypothetical protein